VALINHLITEDYQMYNPSENNSKEMALINHLITEDDQKEIAKALKTIRNTTSHTHRHTNAIQLPEALKSIQNLVDMENLKRSKGHHCQKIGT
jgi:hypothetical protein